MEGWGALLEHREYLVAKADVSAIVTQQEVFSSESLEFCKFYIFVLFRERCVMLKNFVSDEHYLSITKTNLTNKKRHIKKVCRI